MAKELLQAGDSAILAKAQLHDLIVGLIAEDYQVIGPRLGDGAIVYEVLESAADLPQAYLDHQAGGHYRLEKNQRPALFDYVVGPHSWKRYLFPARQRLWQAKRQGQSFNIQTDSSNETLRYAFFGARSCELHAMQIQDQVLSNPSVTDADYQQRRNAAFIVAVNCARPAETCFCSSMGTGPKAHTGFDLALTEIVDEQSHEFVVEVGTQRGAEILAHVNYRCAEQADIERAAEISRQAAESMTHHMPNNAEALLKDHPDHPHWDDVAERCLACGNCTLVCPTCFCTTIEDSTDLSGAIAERWRRWDSCFNSEFSYLHGGSIRTNVRVKYRQWLTHKLAYWHDQFGRSGCVGCGRCITWCPVGIDIIEEVQAFQNSDEVTDGDPRA